MTAIEAWQWALRIALAIAFVFMGVMHFLPAPRRTMAAMIPPGLRFTGILKPANVIAITGVLEIVGGIGLLVPATQLAAGICLALFLVGVFPANAFAAMHPEKFGRLAVPFWPRLIGQLVFIALVLLAAIPL